MFFPIFYHVMQAVERRPIYGNRYIEKPSTGNFRIKQKFHELHMVKPGSNIICERSDNGAGGGTRTRTRFEAERILSPSITRKLLNKLTVSQLAELSNFSRAYISQVKSGQRPPSKVLLLTLKEYHISTRKGQAEIDCHKTVELFLESRRDGLSSRTIDGFYRCYLEKAVPVLGLNPTPAKITHFINSLECSAGGRHAYFRALRVFYNWLYSPKSGYDYRKEDNPITWVDAPKTPKLILPSLTAEQLELLIITVENLRDKAIISLLAESGLRLSELANIRLSDIDWGNRTIRVIGKGNKEGYAPFGSISESYLRDWLKEYHPERKANIWGKNSRGIASMLETLEKKTGLPCNPHTFRRTFACLLRKAGVDTMTIKDLGRWESLEMVQRYTRSVTFHDSLKLYKAPLG